MLYITFWRKRVSYFMFQIFYDILHLLKGFLCQKRSWMTVHLSVVTNEHPPQPLCTLFICAVIIFLFSPAIFILTPAVIPPLLSCHPLSSPISRRLIKVWSRWCIIPGSSHHISSDTTKSDPNASHHSTALPQPRIAAWLQLHEPPILHWHARPA